MAKTNIGNLNVRISADANEFKRGIQQATKATDQFAGGMNKVNQRLQLLVGGGAVAGAVQLARRFEEMGNAVADAVEKLRAGDATIGEVVTTALHGIPILGDFIKMWSSLGRAAAGVLGIETGGQALERATKEMQRQVALGEKLEAISRRIKMASGGQFDQQRAAAKFKLSDELAGLRGLAGPGTQAVEALARGEFEQAMKRIGAAERAALGKELDRVAADEARFLQRLADESQAARDKLVQAGQKVIDEMKTPLERYESKITELNDLLLEQVISWETFGKAVRSARKELEATAAIEAVKKMSMLTIRAPALARGSAEALVAAGRTPRGFIATTKSPAEVAAEQQRRDLLRAMRQIERNTTSLRLLELPPV